MHARVVEDGINQPCDFFVINTVRLFTLITSFPERTPTQTDNLAGDDILFTGVQLAPGMHTDEFSHFLLSLPKPDYQMFCFIKMPLSDQLFFDSSAQGFLTSYHACCTF